jgi:hypothetical protein
MSFARAGNHAYLRQGAWLDARADWILFISLSVNYVPSTTERLPNAAKETESVDVGSEASCGSSYET